MMRFDKVIKDIKEEYEPKGYDIAFVGGKKHRKVFISSGAERRMILLSATENYDTGNIYNIKMQDVRRAVAELPVPQPKEIKVDRGELAKMLAKNEQLLVKAPKEVVEEKVVAKPTNGEQVPAPVQEDVRVYKLSVYIAGHGVLCINCNEEVQERIGAEMRATPVLMQDKRLALVFNESKGVAPTTTRGERIIAYRFARSLVPFQYSEMALGAKEFPNIYARIKGLSLVTDKPLPERFFSGIVVKKETGFDLTRGAELKVQLNGWLEKAKEAGYDPKVKLIDNKIVIEVAEKVYKSI